jgi:tetratricopeptide (TPR) repeat protein
MYYPAAMELLRRRGLHIGAVLILMVALGATAYPAGLVDNLESAATAIRAGHPELAVPALVNAIELEPDVPELYLRAAEGSLAASNTDLAARYLELVPESDSRINCLQLDAALRAGDLSAALELLPNTQCPEHATVLYQEADLLVATGDYEAAEALLEELLNALPASPQASMTLGALLATHDPEASLSYLRLAADLDRDTTHMARELLDIIEDTRSTDARAYTLAQVGQALARRGRWSLAAAAFENALAQDPGYTEARAYYGLALDRSGQDGLIQLQLAVDEAPQAPLPLVLMGKHWLIGGEPDRAVEAYEQAAGLAPRDPLIAIDLGAAYAAAGDLPAAKLAFQYATELDPDDPALWSLLAQFSLDYEVELAEVGLPAAREAAKLLPNDAAALDRLGYTHFLLGNWTLAERFILEAIQLDGNLASAHYHRGLLALSAGDMASGRWALATAVVLDPEGRYGNLALRSLENLKQ